MSAAQVVSEPRPRCQFCPCESDLTVVLGCTAQSAAGERALGGPEALYVYHACVACYGEAGVPVAKKKGRAS